MTNEKITRHDIPEAIQNIIKLAIDIHMIDAVDIYILAMECQENWSDLISELCCIAYNNRHTNPEHNKAIVKAAEKFRKPLT